MHHILQRQQARVFWPWHSGCWVGVDSTVGLRLLRDLDMLIGLRSPAGFPANHAISSVVAEDGVDRLPVTFSLIPNALK